jgi:hypothetical protein
MKTLLPCLLVLGSGVFFAPQSEAVTYPGQACQSRTPGSPLTYVYGARNNNVSSVEITCPVTRTRDNGTAAVTAAVYFSNDGVSKTCRLENFNINTGTAGVWTSRTEVRRLELTLPSTLQWFPLAFYCSLPARSQIMGYYVSE